MAKIFRFRDVPTAALLRRKIALTSRLTIPPDAIRASLVRQHLTCGKKNCRCRRGRKHGPFEYLVQSLAAGETQKFLLRTVEQRYRAGIGIAAYANLQGKLEELSQINTELLRRGALSTG